MIDRYKLNTNNGNSSGFMERHDNGDYIKYEDYLEQQSIIQKYKTQVSILKNDLQVYLDMLEDSVVIQK